MSKKRRRKENVISGIARLVRENGIFSTFGGLPAMLAKQVRTALVNIKEIFTPFLKDF